MKKIADMSRVGSGLVSLCLGPGLFENGFELQNKALIVTGFVVMVTGIVNLVVIHKIQSEESTHS